jgi:hypothetical protein
MCGRYALYGPISRHRKNRPIDELPERYPDLVDAIDMRPIRFQDRSDRCEGDSQHSGGALARVLVTG